MNKIANAEFRVTFTETNLRYLLGDENPDQDKIARCRAQLAEAKEELKQILNLVKIESK
jgi:hypothetical protein